jgi:hypothetical protein
MARVFLWRRKPASDEAARRKIARAFSTTGEVALVAGGDPPSVLVPMGKVFRHFWKDHNGERWDQVPVIREAIRQVVKISGPRNRRGTELYTSHLDVVDRSDVVNRWHVATYVLEKGAGRRWKTSFATEASHLRTRETAAGVTLWARGQRRNPAETSTGVAVATPARNMGPGSPTPTPPLAESSWSGRSSALQDNSSTPVKSPLRTLVALGALALAVGALRGQRAA